MFDVLEKALKIALSSNIANNFPQVIMKTSRLSDCEVKVQQQELDSVKIVGDVTATDIILCIGELLMKSMHTCIHAITKMIAMSKSTFDNNGILNIS